MKGDVVEVDTKYESKTSWSSLLPWQTYLETDVERAVSYIWLRMRSSESAASVISIIISYHANREA